MEKLVQLEDNGVTEELNVCAYKSTGLFPGTTVTHKNEGKSAGSSGIIKYGTGKIVDVDYQGIYAWGGHCFTAEVEWSNGKRTTVGTSLLQVS